MNLTELQDTKNKLRDILRHEGYSAHFLNHVAIAEEWLESRQVRFLHLMIEKASQYTGRRYSEIENQAYQLLSWGEEEAQLIFSVACYLALKRNPSDIAKHLEYEENRERRKG